MGWIFFILLVIFCVVLQIGGSKNQAANKPYYTRAKIIAKIDEMPNCWLCSCEKDGEVITAMYCDTEDVFNIGDEISIVYENDEACMPLVKKPKPEWQ